MSDSSPTPSINDAINKVLVWIDRGNVKLQDMMENLANIRAVFVNIIRTYETNMSETDKKIKDLEAALKKYEDAIKPQKTKAT